MVIKWMIARWTPALAVGRVKLLGLGNTHVNMTHKLQAHLVDEAESLQLPEVDLHGPGAALAGTPGGGGDRSLGTGRPGARNFLRLGDKLDKLQIARTFHFMVHNISALVRLRLHFMIGDSECG